MPYQSLRPARRGPISRVARLLSIGGVLAALVAFPTFAFGVDLEVDKAVGDQFAWGTGLCTESIGNAYAWGCFHADDHDPIGHTGDDIFKIRDESRDGYRVGIHWRLEDGSRRGLCYSTAGVINGIGPLPDIHPVMYCNKDFVEGKRLEFRVGRCDGDVDTCLVLADWRDWSGWVNVTT